jgi:hypothetical protein
MMDVVAIVDDQSDGGLRCRLVGLRTPQVPAGGRGQIFQAGEALLGGVQDEGEAADVMRIVLRHEQHAPEALRKGVA